MHPNIMFYAVRVGRVPGIYVSWDDAKQNVTGYPAAAYKKFSLETDAITFMNFKSDTVDTVLASAAADAEILVCFTDGSSINNGSRTALCGYGVVWPDHMHLNSSNTLPSTTNNRAEYAAVVHAVKQADTIDPTRMVTLVVYTDSLLIVKSMTTWIATWKRSGYRTSNGQPVSNTDLVKTLDELMSTRLIKFKHVRAHTDAITWEANHNRLADKLANAGALQMT
jgi:ribonuclease HI